MIKQNVLRTYARMFGLRVLVETGTFRGDMIDALRSDFDSIYSIELSETLYQRAKKRFQDNSHIEVIHGDSGAVLESLITRLNQPALFWLDGHYSGDGTARSTCDSPIKEELRHVLGAAIREHVVVIDDARLFGTDPHYPSIDELREYIAVLHDGVELTVEYDSIRIVPRGRK